MNEKNLNQNPKNDKCTIDITSIVDCNIYLRDINKKEIPIGSVAYYLDTQRHSCDPKKIIKYGIVKEHFPSAIILQLLERPDIRYIEGVSVNDFETPSEWRKLPKGWNGSFNFFEEETEKLPDSEEFKEHNDIRRPENILWLYQNGYLVNAQDNSHRKFTVEINKSLGWRIVDEIPKFDEFHPDFISLSYANVYSTYEEAQRIRDKDYAQYYAQSEMSDYEWAVYQIDNALDKWAGTYCITETEKNKCREWLLEQKNVEDINVRIYCGNIQWKYSKNKKWLNIVI